MKPLIERQRDRAQRVVNNATESAAVLSAGIGAASAAFATFAEAYRTLAAPEREQLHEALADQFKELQALEEEDRPFSLAGIGTVDPNLAPGGLVRKVHEEPHQNGELPDAAIDPANGNLNGQALDAGAGGWGSTPTDDEGADTSGNGGGASRGRRKAAGAPAEGGEGGEGTQA